MHLSPHLGKRMVAGKIEGKSVFIRELLPQDLKIELERLRVSDAMKAASFLAGVVGKAHARQMDAMPRKSWSNELMTPTAPGWEALQQMPVGLGETAVAAADGKIYVAGGYDTRGVLQIYYIATDTWMIGHALPSGTDNAGAVASGGKIRRLRWRGDPAGPDLRRGRHQLERGAQPPVGPLLVGGGGRGRGGAPRGWVELQPHQQRLHRDPHRLRPRERHVPPRARSPTWERRGTTPTPGSSTGSST